MQMSNWYLVLVSGDYVSGASIQVSEGSSKKHAIPFSRLANKLHKGIYPDGHLALHMLRAFSEEQAIKEMSEQYGIAESHLIAFELPH